MDKIREKVINFMEHNEILTKLENEKWYTMEDSLVELIKNCITETTYNTEVIPLATGEQLHTTINFDGDISINDDFGQQLLLFQGKYNSEMWELQKEKIQKQELYDILDEIFESYDYSDDLKQIVDTYIEDITIGNGEEAVEQEVKTIKHEFETMNEKDFCIAWGIYKVGNTYIKP